MYEHDPPELKTVYRDCGDCKGKGTIRGLSLTRSWSLDDPYEVRDVKCVKCDGEGQVSREICSKCERPEYSDYEPACDCYEREEDKLADLAELMHS